MAADVCCIVNAVTFWLIQTFNFGLCKKKLSLHFALEGTMSSISWNSCYYTFQNTYLPVFPSHVISLL